MRQMDLRRQYLVRHYSLIRVGQGVDVGPYAVSLSINEQLVVERERG